MRYILDLDFWHLLWPNFQKAFMISLLKSIFLMSDKLFWFVSIVKGEHPQDLQFECLRLRPFLRSIDQRLFIAMLLNVWKRHLSFLYNFFVQCLILSYFLDVWHTSVLLMSFLLRCWWPRSLHERGFNWLKLWIGDRFVKFCPILLISKISLSALGKSSPKDNFG